MVFYEKKTGLSYKDNYIIGECHSMGALPALPSPPQLGTVQKANPEPMMRRLEQRDQSREFIDPHPGH